MAGFFRSKSPKPEAKPAKPAAKRAQEDIGYDTLLDGRDDPDDLKEYVRRLQQVVLQQHTARREDWSHFHARETGLQDELNELRHFAEDRDSLRWYETKLMEELRLERRKRIDLEARLTGADRWRTEAIAAGRMARNAEVNMSFGQEAELAEAHEWQRNAEKFRAGEERAVASEKLAEDNLRRARQELGRQSRDLEKRTAEAELRAQAGEAEALSAAWKLSGELRSELDSVRLVGPYRGGGSSPRANFRSASPAPNVSQARRALGNVRGVKEQLDGMLTDYPYPM